VDVYPAYEVVSHFVNPRDENYGNTHATGVSLVVEQDFPASQSLQTY
jgi:hypothetical protein